MIVICHICALLFDVRVRVKLPRRPDRCAMCGHDIEPDTSQDP